MLQNSHEAGVGGLEGEILNGFVSFIKSIYECQKKRKDPKEALKCTAIATLKGGVRSYGIASVGSLLVDMMQNNANQVIQSCGGHYALAGQALIPIPVVGALIGGFVGAALSEVFLTP